MPPSDVWIVIDGHFENMKLLYEMNRDICFNVAAYGNSDPKHFPKSKYKFMPFFWDPTKKAAGSNNSILASHERMKARREELEKKRKERNHGR